MIRINLLKAFTSGVGSEAFSAGASASERDQALIQAMKRLALVVLGPTCMIIYEMQSLPKLQHRLTQVQNEVNETIAFNQSKSGLAAEIKKYEDEQQKINAQMNFVNKIARDKINELKLFQHLQYTTPENVWINRLEFKDNILSLNIESDTSGELDRFSDLLSNSGFLSNLIPGGQTVMPDPYGIAINTFKLDLKAQFMEANEP